LWFPLSKASTASSTIVRRCGGHRACATKTGGSGEEEEGRDIVVLAETGASEVNYEEEINRERGRLDAYYMCGCANKFYLGALCRCPNCL
jgi:hypothetical protein